MQPIPQPIPRLAGDIDPAWLNEVLRERHPDAVVTGVEVIERHELTNAHARIRLTYDGPCQRA